jgi:signal transduction histidine kinase
MDSAHDSPARLEITVQLRAERLDILWKVTLIIAVLVVLFAFSLGLSMLRTQAMLQLVVSGLIVIAACIGARHFLQIQRYEPAVWAYALGLLAAITLFMFSPGATGPTDGRLMAFAFPVLILTVGLLLPVRAVIITLVLSILATLLVPTIGMWFTVTISQALAIGLMVIAAGIASQTSGEVYGIAQWALESYSKERALKEKLFDSQEELNRSYVRQKVLADDLQKTNVELEAARAAALEAKNFRGQFLANMSHELRTPLNAVIGFSETMLNFPMMYDNQELAPAYKTDLTQIYGSGKHLLQLINDILDLSKVDAGRLEMEIEAVDLDPIFKGVLSTAIGLVGDKPIKIKREAPEGMPQIRGDSLRIRQVILNLLSNAAKFTDKGSISVGASVQDDGFVRIWVKDTGIGIPPEDMASIFEEFRQGASGRRKGRAGSGLGLAISRQLLTLMGGQIWVESRVNEGSTFSFTLPLFAPERAPELSPTA